MAVYKVAQDVEADDKLLGPFSFRQFIYLIIVAICLILAWGLGQVFVGFAILPLPLILFFGALALPLRKDQPMEIYMAALISFYLKPRKRLWVPDGIESLVQITAPKVTEIQRTKDLTQTEAERRLSYLADIADTEGWAVRRSAQPNFNNTMMTDAFFEAQQTEDVLDESGGISQSFDAMINQADEQRRQNMINRMQQASNASPDQQVQAPQFNPFAPPDPYVNMYTPNTTQPINQTIDTTNIQFNPYPDSIRQSVINPLSQQDQVTEINPQIVEQTPVPTPVQPESQTVNTPIYTETAQSTSVTTISPDIINLASNTSLSVKTIQNEANRIQKKAEDDGEVFIPLH